MAKPAISKEQMNEQFQDRLLEERKSLAAEFRKRKLKVERVKVAHSDVQELVQKGWSEHRKLKRMTWLERPKKHQVQLEDDFWCLLYRMGYQDLNGRHFSIPYRRPDDSVDKKQIDIFAKDDETVLVIECKSSVTRRRRSLQKDIAETTAFKGQMARAIRGYYSGDFRPKIIWLYVTRNIIWSAPDLERANAAKISVLTENEFGYYEAYIGHMGPAGRYQVLAELLKGQSIPEMKGVKVPAVKGKIGGHKYYSFVTTPRQLLKISFVNHLALNHPDGRPAYQRMVSMKRLKEIAKFIEDGGFFPTNLLVNFTGSCRFDPISNKGSSAEGRYGWLYLPEKYKSAWVIDGQHRLFGYSFANETHWDDDIFVLAFEKLDTSDEAELFITINSKQKNVPASILVALKADLQWGSNAPQDRLEAIHSALAKSLNSSPSSPLSRRMVMEGIKVKPGTPLTIPETVKGIDRSKLLGRMHNNQLIPGPLSSTDDEATIQRARKILEGYFSLLMDANAPRWSRGKEGFLCSNPGIRAYLLLLAQVLDHLDSKKGFDSYTAPEKLVVEKVQSQIKSVLSFVKGASDEEFRKLFGRKFGEGGVKEYFFNLCDLMQDTVAGFGPDEYREYVSRRTDTRLADAHSDVIRINALLTDFVLGVLKREYGEEPIESGEPKYWAIGVENKNAKNKAYQKMQDDPLPKRKPLFAYLDLLDLGKIIRQKNNWPLFQPFLSLRMPEENKGKTYYLDWIERFNELRRIPAHSSSMRLYDEDDYTFLAWLNTELVPKLESGLASLD